MPMPPINIFDIAIPKKVKKSVKEMIKVRTTRNLIGKGHKLSMRVYMPLTI